MKKPYTQCRYCRLKKCLLAGMNIKCVGKMKPGGNPEENGPFNYTDDQIEQILNGSIPPEIFSNVEIKSKSSESPDMIIPCQICLTRQSVHRHFGAKSCRPCKDFFVRSIQHAKGRVFIFN